MTSNWFDFVPPLRDYPWPSEWRSGPVTSLKPRPVTTPDLWSRIFRTYLGLRAQITNRGRAEPSKGSAANRPHSGARP